MMKTKLEGWRWRRSLAGWVVVALMPKCIACVAAYLAAGAGAATIGLEWCGGEAESSAGSAWLYGWMAAVGATAFAARAFGRQHRPKRAAGESVPIAAR